MKTSFTNMLMREASGHESEKSGAGYAIVEPTTNTLQLLIEKNALKRLESDIAELTIRMRKEKLFKTDEGYLLIKRRKINRTTLTLTDWDDCTVNNLADFLDSDALKWALVKTHLPVYIKEETDKLLTNVASLNEQMEHLNYEVSHLTQRGI